VAKLIPKAWVLSLNHGLPQPPRSSASHPTVCPAASLVHRRLKHCKLRTTVTLWKLPDFVESELFVQSTDCVCKDHAAASSRATCEAKLSLLSCYDGFHKPVSLTWYSHFEANLRSGWSQYILPRNSTRMKRQVERHPTGSRPPGSLMKSHRRVTDLALSHNPRLWSILDALSM